MAIDNYPIRKTGSDDNERAQLNKALREISNILQRAEGWDAAVSWGDHNEAGYAAEPTELEQFFALGTVQNLQVSQTIEVSPNGTERNKAIVTWVRVPDDTIVYDLEIRVTNTGQTIDPNDVNDILTKSTLFSVPIIGNETQDDTITFQIFLEPNQQYWFRARIRKNTFTSAWSAFETITTFEADAKPDAPTSLEITPIIEGAQLKWALPTNRANIESTRIYRRELGETTDPIIAEVAKPGDTFTDGDLSSTTTYQYKVTCLSYRDVESDPTGWISVQPLQVDADFDTPAVPQNLSATQELVTDNIGGQAFVNVDISWDVVSGDNITYDLDVLRGLDVPVATPVISNPESGSRANYELQVPVGTLLKIRVRSRNATATSAWTTPALEITTNADATAVGAITNLVATPLYQGAVVNWDNPSNPNYHYAIVERRKVTPTAGAYQNIGRVTRPSSFLFDDVGELTINTDPNSPDYEQVLETYQYRVTGYSSNNQPGPSAETGVIRPSNIPENSITANQIVARSITAQEIEAETITSNEINVNELTANSTFISNIELESDLNISILADNPPTTRPNGSAIKKGDMWFDTNDGDKPYTYDGRSPFSTDGWIPSYTIIDGGNITTGTIDAARIDVSGVITAGSLIVGGDNISLLTNDAGFTDFDAFDVQDAIENNVTIIDGSKITTGTIDAARIDVTGVISAGGIIVGGDNISSLTNDAGYTDFDAFDVQAAIENNVTIIDGSKITTGTIDAARIDVSGVITAGNIIIGGDNISDLTNDLGFTDFDAFDVEDAIANNVTIIDGGKITTGTVDAARIDVSGVISAGNIIVGGDNISSLTNDSGFTDFDAFDVEDAIANNVTVIDGGKITTGTVDAARIDVSGVITAGGIIVSGDNISDLTNDAGYTDFSPSETTITIRSLLEPTTRPPLPNQINGDALVEGDIWIDTGDGDKPYSWNGSSWIEAYTIIDGGNITTGTIDASVVNVTNINADNINTGTIGAAQLEDGSIDSVKFTSTIESDNYVQGSTGWIIGVSNGAAEFSNLVARGNFIAGTSPNERVEITVNDPNNYRIWVGSGTKNDTNGVFWVKSDGSVKIDKAVFGIGAEPNVGTTSGSTTAGVTQTVNPVVATFTQFESNGQDVSVNLSYDYLARKITNSPSSCPIPSNTTGTLALQRSTNNGSTWSANIDTASFTIATSSRLIDDPDPSIPLQCIQESGGTATRTLVDSSPIAEGSNVRYRVVMSSWSNFFLSSANQIINNEINASYTQ